MNQFATDFLTARSSALTGMGTLLNLAGSYYLYNISKTPAEADRRALASDWVMIGQDLRSVLDQELKANADRDQNQLQLAL
jgi:hypothetical protein